MRKKMINNIFPSKLFPSLFPIITMCCFEQIKGIHIKIKISQWQNLWSNLTHNSLTTIFLIEKSLYKRNPEKIFWSSTLLSTQCGGSKYNLIKYSFDFWRKLPQGTCNYSDVVHLWIWQSNFIFLSAPTWVYDKSNLLIPLLPASCQNYCTDDEWS